MSSVSSLIRKNGVLEMAAAVQLVLEAEEDADLPVLHAEINGGNVFV